MMGLGYLGSSSSSSASSNLSPLAPPFTVGRSNSNHNKPVVNSNSVSHLNDPSYFTSSWPYSHSSTARQKKLTDSPRTTTLPSNDSGYMIPELGTAGSWCGLNSNGKHGLEQITPGGSHWGAVYPRPKRVTDSLSYNLSEAKAFYPPYASSDDIPLVTFSEPSYDLLSSSGVAHGDENETSQVDYTGSLSGLEYNQQQQQQDGVWSEGKQVKKKETDDRSFFSDAASLAYNNYLNQGAYGAETSSKSKDDPSLFYYADIIRRANDTGPCSSNGRNNNHIHSHRLEFDPNNDLSKGGGSTFRAFPMFSESHPLIQSPEPLEDLWNSQNSYNPYEKRYHMFDDHMITKSSTLVIKPPAAGSKSLEIGSSLSALNINDVVCGSHNNSMTLKEKGGIYLAPNQLSFQIGTTDAAAAACSTKQEEDQLNFEFKASFQVPEMMSIPKVNTTENVVKTTAAANSFDHHNNNPAAEDSPCWKGAPTTTTTTTSQFLPFEAAESPQPQPPMKKLQTGNDAVDDYSSFIYPSSSSDETTSGVKVSSSKAPSNGGVCSVHDDTIKPPNKEHGESTSDADSQIPKLKLPTTPEMDIIIISPEPDMASQLLYGDDAKAKKANPSGLVKSLYNLSDLLLLHCSNDEFAALKEHDLEALDHVVRNLGVCMSKLTSSSSSKQNSSNMSQEAMSGGDDDQKPMSDSFGKDVEKLLQHASPRGAEAADPPKDHNMVQAIKKVLDENLECKVELPSETLLYKNLWLEAEAELCSLSFRARFERLKRRETDRSKDAAAASAVKESDPKTPPKHIDDVEAGVMARFSILKRREDPNPVKLQVAAAAGIIKDCGNKGCQLPEPTVIGKDIDPWVMDRLNILKRRGELNANAVEEKEVRDCGKEGPMGGHFQDEGNKEEEEEEEGEEEAVGSGGGSDWEHILRDDEFSWRLS